MQELSVLLTLAAVFAVALVSPGPDVALVVRTSLHQGRRAGLASALGLACGILLHTTLVLTGVSLLLSRTPVLFAILQALGALYLAWLGVGALRLAVKEGDLEHGCFLSGQIAAMVDHIQPAAEIVRSVMEEAEPILKGAAAWVK